MKIKVLFLTFISIVSCYTPTGASIIGCSGLEYKGAKVLLFPDQHIETQLLATNNPIARDIIENQQRQMNLLTPDLETSPYDVTYLIEHRPYNTEFVRKNLTEDVTIFPAAIPIFHAVKHDMQAGSITYIPFDTRTEQDIKNIYSKQHSSAHKIQQLKDKALAIIHAGATSDLQKLLIAKYVDVNGAHSPDDYLCLETNATLLSTVFEKINLGQKENGKQQIIAVCGGTQHTGLVYDMLKEAGAASIVALGVQSVQDSKDLLGKKLSFTPVTPEAKPTNIFSALWRALKAPFKRERVYIKSVLVTDFYQPIAEFIAKKN